MTEVEFPLYRRAETMGILDGGSALIVAPTATGKSALGTSVGELLGKSGPHSQSVNFDIPESLRQFAEEANLPDAEIRMLAGIRYRGKQPKTADDWRYIYESIRLRTEGR